MRITKVLMLNHNHVGYGTYWRVFFLGKYLSVLGCKVTMVCASGENFDLKIRKKRISENFTMITLPRVKYSRYFTGQTFRLLLSTLQVLVYKYDIVHCFTVAQPQIGLPAVLAKKIGKKLIVDWDDLWGGGFANYHFLPVRYVLEKCETSIPKFADRVTVVSEYLREKSISFGTPADLVIKIPNGCNVDHFKLLSKAESRAALGLVQEPLVVSMGHTYMESFNFLLDAFERVIKEIPEAKFMIIGRVEFEKALRNKLAESIIMAGEQPYDKIPAFLSVADVLVLPMEDSAIERARFPIRLGDYLASGRPVVSNAVGEVKSMLENNKCGLTSPPNDAEAFAENIVKVINDKELQETLGKRARKAAEENSWAKVAEKLDLVYRQLCE